MKVYSLLGSWDYEGSELLGVFTNVIDLQKHVDVVCADPHGTFDRFYYIESELGAPIEPCGAGVDVFQSV